jgi:uncharacterized protein (DUF1501 family)
MYAGLHRELALAAPGAADGARRLDGLFGLHPSLGFLHERYLAGELIVFHAAASPYRNRSHFDGQIVLESGLSRTAAMNGTRGTDHGTGGCAFLAGGAVRGGRVIADWPGLAASALLENRDLRPTLDPRSVFKGVLDEHLHIDANTLATRVFPDSSNARPLRGLIRA